MNKFETASREAIAWARAFLTDDDAAALVREFGLCVEPTTEVADRWLERALERCCSHDKADREFILGTAEVIHCEGFTRYKYRRGMWINGVHDGAFEVYQAGLPSKLIGRSRDMWSAKMCAWEHASHELIMEILDLMNSNDNNNGDER